MAEAKSYDNPLRGFIFNPPAIYHAFSLPLEKLNHLLKLDDSAIGSCTMKPLEERLQTLKFEWNRELLIGLFRDLDSLKDLLLKLMYLCYTESKVIQIVNR